MISRRGWSRLGVVFVFALMVLGTSSQVLATEGGGSIYPGGNEDFMAGALPPPGFYFLNYFLYYHAGDYDDLRLPNGAKAKDVFGSTPDFDLDVIANAFRFLYVTPIKIFGADWAMHLIVPFMHMDASIRLPNGLHLKGDNTGLGDITIDPIALGWHWKNWHMVAALDINLPTGDYDSDEVANLGRNYWNFEPILAVTYLSDNGFEVSAKFMYDFNTENTDTNYTSGQEFHFDYLVGKHICNWKFGINGSYYIQTTDDSFDNEIPGFDGNKGQSFGIGPAVFYQFRNMFLELKYQFETAVENRPEGQKLWFRYLYAF